jgi:protoheme IX farnesyltransferase
MNTLTLSLPVFGQLLQLGKPRVVSLIVFTAIIGMFLAKPGLPPAQRLLFGTIAIALLATSAAALNCLIEQQLDAPMARTRARPLLRGDVTTRQALTFVAFTGVAGLVILHSVVNPLTMWLTLAAFMGYAIVYTIVLKPRTRQNIVIGGASGATRPALGLGAVTGGVSVDAFIFAWTPLHFWSLALYRRDEHARAGVPMLPVTHWERYTRLSILTYTIILAAICLVPLASGMSGWDLSTVHVFPERGVPSLCGQALCQLQRSTGAAHVSLFDHVPLPHVWCAARRSLRARGVGALPGTPNNVRSNSPA